MALDMRFDNRLIERNIEKGIITREEYNEYIANLADAEKNAETLALTQPLFDKNDEDADGSEEG